eukprot:12891005-Prorocentrum_lima.AAC.1
MRAPPPKFEPKAQSPSVPTRDDTVTFGGTSATRMNAAWDVVDLIYMVVEHASWKLEMMVKFGRSSC